MGLLFGLCSKMRSTDLVVANLNIAVHRKSHSRLAIVERGPQALKLIELTISQRRKGKQLRRGLDPTPFHCS